MTQRCVEIRSYRLKPGGRDAFDRLMSDISVPMLRRWQTDVVSRGASAHDEVSYYLIRAYASADDRQRRGTALRVEPVRPPAGAARLDLTASQALRHATPADGRTDSTRATTQWITRPISVVVPMDDHTIDRLRNKEKDDV